MGPQPILLFGGPGAGKGTQAHQLSAALAIPHVSSGDMLRARQQAGESLSAMQRGDLLPDDVVTDLVFARLDEPDALQAAVLDGFPRNLAQARALDTWLDERSGAVKAALYLEVPGPELVSRIVARQLASHRGDDTPVTARRRVDVFLQLLPAVLAHYADRRLLHRIDGTRSVEDVQHQILRVLRPSGAR